MQLDDNNGKLRANIEPNLECFPYWRKAGRGCDCDMGIFDTRVYVYIWIGYFCSMDKVG